VANVAETAGALAAEIVERGAGLGLTAVPARLRAPHYVGLRSPAAFPLGLPGRLAAERVYISIRGGQTLRITPHVYNERPDVDRLFAVLRPALEAGRD
jgi:selenocysteine lyase/cysteine desulfurase